MGLSLSLKLPILATHPHRHLVLGSQTSAAAHDFHVGAKSAHTCAAGPHSESLPALECAAGTSLRASPQMSVHLEKNN